MTSEKLRRRVSKGAGSRSAGLAMAFKLLQSAQHTWRRLDAHALLPLVRAGVRFVDGSQKERVKETASGRQRDQPKKEGSGLMGRTRTTSMRSSLPLLVLIGVIATVPVCCVGLFLAENEYAWMSSAGDTVPPDCDIAAADGFFLTAFGGSLAVVLLFGRRAWIQRARLLVAAVAIAALMLLAIGARAPGYLAERSRAQQLCSK